MICLLYILRVLKLLNWCLLILILITLIPSPESKHMGETREERINQYHEESSIPVLGLREGSLLHVTDNSAKLRGLKNAKLFIKEQESKEFEVGSDLSFLLHS
ncbi:Alpha-aspartyl dipeptidase [Armadillidium nasatum]|uniref:Alpha-aspartyl dipeptidase n=1 Tax=Armadillidium nasatum TaxID=96803 RepID=A0A5N5SXH6_9CRUS|nr:Alpha-aspartyl dipeptidase [Armadillidium nasatum]